MTICMNTKMCVLRSSPLSWNYRHADASAILCLCTYIHIYACLYTCAICIWIADESLVAAANKNKIDSCKQQSLCCTHPFGAVVRTQQPVSKFNSWPSPPIQAVSKWDNAVQVQRSISPLERALMHSSIDALRRENDERH